MHRRSWLQAFTGVVDLNPDLDGGAVGIGGGAHHGDLTFHFILAIGSREYGGLAHFHCGGFGLRNIDARDHTGYIHDGNQRRPRVGHLFGIERTIGDDARYGAQDA